MKVKDVMRTSVVTLSQSDNMSVAEDVMGMGRIRHLPVVDGKRHVVGIVTQRDLYKAAISSVLGFTKTKEHEWLGKIKVSDVMTSKVTMIDPEAGVVEAVDKMLTKKYGCLPVVDKEGCLVGLLTESDCLRCFRDLLKMGLFEVDSDPFDMNTPFVNRNAATEKGTTAPLSNRGLFTVC